jgi:hypothetical protein
LDGCFEDGCGCATRYYVWNTNHFTLVSQRVNQSPPACKK